MKIAITGASGLIGKKIIHALLRDKHTVIALARSANKLPEVPEKNIFSWSDSEEVPTESIVGCDAVIHLAGEGIADKRWTEERKKRLWDSRVQGTSNLISAFKKLSPKDRPKLFISGSAIGYYANSDDPQDESSKAGSNFLADLCVAWEAEALKAEELEIKTVILRTGLVLSEEGGLLEKTAPVVLGSGQQWMSWIHIEDYVDFVMQTLTSKTIQGPYNLTAPKPVKNYDFTKAYAKCKGIPLTISAPEVALKVALGELAQAVLANQKVLPKKMLDSGFKFKYEDIHQALADLVGRRKLTENLFSAKQFVPLNRNQVFSFFSKAENLEILTPSFLNFHIQKKSTPEIEKGTLIDYTLKIHGVPVKWRTLIKEWDPDQSFVDFQLKGPYKKWHHLHTFEDVEGGTLISDQVTFEIPGWIFGQALLPLIRKDVEQIFSYRQKKIKELYLNGDLK